ncbi:MAG: immune inhibitor A [Ignavibacteriaceae bacterium]|nr:immune inhibitor A [Ignavibacteriaceae bacterium]
MTKYFLLAVLFFSISINLLSQNYKEVKIFLNDLKDIQTLLNAGMEFDHLVYEKDNSIKTFIGDNDFAILQSTGFNYEILIDDWYSYYASLSGLTESERQQFIKYSKDNFNVGGFGYGSMGGFYTLAEINAKLDTMYMLYPNIITQKFSIGNSIENRPIYAVKISDNPTINESEPQVHINALIHAREPQGMMTVMYYMYYLLENYGTDPEVTYLVNNREIYFIPCINPDGYEYNRSTNPGGGGMWRKNRRLNAGGSYGVDLNRNFGYMWGYDNVGSSGTPSSETYRGTAAFSEPETQAIRDFMNTKIFKTTLNYHTYGNYLLYPWGYINSPTADNSIFVEYSGDIVAYNGYENGQPPQILYTVNGSTDDWMYGEQTTKPKIFAMTPEVGTTGFWPTQAEIFPLAIENLQPNLYYTWVAGAFVKMINPSFSQQYFNPGDYVEISIPQLRNKGLSDASSVTLSLSSDNPQITINNGNISVGNISARTTISNTQKLSFTLGAGLAADVKVKMIITVSTSGTPMYADTMSFIVGTPVIIWSDTTNDPAILWNITATPTTPKWESTTTSYHSTPNSYTDSKTGNYVSNATVTMTSKDPINLSTYQHPRLGFWTRYDIEENWDYGQVKISTNNGTSWIPLAGNYTEPGVGTFQPNGQPLYDGTQTTWIQEEISLTGLNAAQNKFQFQLRTDGAVAADGWYVDDIVIYVYGIVPVELSSFTASAFNTEVVLNWSTSSELNNQGFEIQRKSLSNEFGWQTIGFVEGSGNSTTVKNYSFTDKNPIRGTLLYRLKQIDFDGSFKFYVTEGVNFVGVYNYALEQNYPNPFNPSTIINYSIPDAGNVSLKIYNLLGSEVATLVDEYMEAGNYSVEFSTEDVKNSLGSGVYIYTLKSGSFTQTRKMVVLK